MDKLNLPWGVERITLLGQVPRYSIIDSKGCGVFEETSFGEDDMPIVMPFVGLMNRLFDLHKGTGS